MDHTAPERDGAALQNPKKVLDSESLRLVFVCCEDKYWVLFVSLSRGLYFGVFEMGSGRLFVDLLSLSWEPQPGLMGWGGRGRPDSLGLVLALKERLMYPLSSPAI